MAAAFESLATERSRSGLVRLLSFACAEYADLARVGWAERRRCDSRSVVAVRREVTPTLRRGWRGQPALMARVAIGQAVRHVRRRPASAAAFVLTFGLGLGIGSSMYAVVSAIALKPLPYREAERLVELWMLDEERNQDRPSLTAEAFVAWRGYTSVLEGMEGWAGPATRGSVVLEGDAPERVRTTAVTTGLFEFLGIRPRVGRGFEAGDGAAGAAPVIVLSHDLWRRRFGGDASVLGRPIRFDGGVYTVVGIMPDGFRFPHGQTEAWFPMSASRESIESGGSISAIARLRPGLTVETAEAALIGRNAEAQAAGAAPAGVRPMVVDLDFMRTPERTRFGMLVLLGAVLLMLLIAASNVLALRLADGLRRRRELAIRASLGAGRAQLAAQLGAESVVLSVAALTLGLLIGHALITGLIPMLPDQLGVHTGGRALTLWPDGVVFAAAAAALFGPATGVLPALLVAGRAGALRSGMWSTADARGMRLQSGLVVAEIALSLVLLTGAGLLTNSFVRLIGRDPVFDTERLLVVELTLGRSYATPAARDARFDRIASDFARIAGVDAVAASTSMLPLSRARFRPTIEGGFGEPIELDDFLPYHEVTPGFLRVAGIPLLSGRSFDDADAGRPVAIVNDVMAERLWPGSPAVGKRFRIGDSQPWHEVIGVAHDVPMLGPRDPWGEGMEFYTPLPADAATAGRTFILRTAGEPAALAAAARRAVWDVDPAQPFERIIPFEDAFGDTISRERFFLLLIAMFAALATGLAAVGLHAVLSQVLGRRTREIGIRVALGAGRGSVALLLARSGMVLVVAGVLVGACAALGLTRFLEALLFGVEPRDPMTFATQAVLVLGVGLLAMIGPIARGLRVQPGTVMREEG